MDAIRAGTVTLGGQELPVLVTATSVDGSDVAFDLVRTLARPTWRNGWSAP